MSTKSRSDIEEILLREMLSLSAFYPKEDTHDRAVRAVAPNATSTEEATTAPDSDSI